MGYEKYQEHSDPVAPTSELDVPHAHPFAEPHSIDELESLGVPLGATSGDLTAKEKIARHEALLDMLHEEELARRAALKAPEHIRAQHEEDMSILRQTMEERARDVEEARLLYEPHMDDRARDGKPAIMTPEIEARMREIEERATKVRAKEESTDG